MILFGKHRATKNVRIKDRRVMPLEILLEPVTYDSTVGTIDSATRFPFKLMLRLVPENRSEGYSHKYLAPKEYEYVIYLTVSEYDDFKSDMWAYFNTNIYPKIGELAYD